LSGWSIPSAAPPPSTGRRPMFDSSVRTILSMARTWCLGSGAGSPTWST